MKTDVRGCSMCPPGTERHEQFNVGGKVRYQYDYRTPEGKLFSCVANSLEAAREKRDAWLEMEQGKK